jgi:hypothetical protein
MINTNAAPGNSQTSPLLKRAYPIVIIKIICCIILSRFGQMGCSTYWVEWGMELNNASRPTETGNKIELKLKLNEGKKRKHSRYRNPKIFLVPEQGYLRKGFLRL